MRECAEVKCSADGQEINAQDTHHNLGHVNKIVTSSFDTMENTFRDSSSRLSRQQSNPPLPLPPPPPPPPRQPTQTATRTAMKLQSPVSIQQSHHALTRAGPIAVTCIYSAEPPRPHTSRPRPAGSGCLHLETPSFRLPSTDFLPTPRSGQIVIDQNKCA